MKKNNEPSKAPSDFNDLQNRVGKDELARQLLSAANDAPEESPVPSAKEGRAEISTLLKRYALISPDAKVWDLSKRRVIKSTAFKSIYGAKLHTEWLAHDDRLTVEMDDVREQEAAAQKEGAGGLSLALERYVYLYPSDSAWDKTEAQVVPLSALRYAIADCFNFWVSHPYRQQVNQDNLVFDPSESVNEETHINMFTGFVMQPKEEPSKAGPIHQLVLHLCNGERDVYRWLLDWLAFPLQHKGSKMASAVLMHSETQGTGKSLLFEEVLKAIYGRYGATLGQHQLESQYTDWRSNLLFALFEEILSRDQKYNHSGTLKHMITGKTTRIEKKFVSGWEEANYMNAVFLSNEIQPFPLEPSDRRFLVIWPRKKLTEELKAEVLAAINDGGVQAFYHELLQRDLSGFTTHTEPPITKAKERLIDFGRAPWDVFYQDWKADNLDVPYGTCRTLDLFKAYRMWCNERREHVVGENKFSSFISSRERRRSNVHYLIGRHEAKATVFQIGRPEEGLNQQEWIGRCVSRFQEALRLSDAEGYQ